jgi:hypothetical protein
MLAMFISPLSLSVCCVGSSTNAYMLMYRQVDKQRNNGQYLCTVCCIETSYRASFITVGFELFLGFAKCCRYFISFTAMCRLYDC